MGFGKHRIMEIYCADCLPLPVTEADADEVHRLAARLPEPEDIKKARKLKPVHCGRFTLRGSNESEMRFIKLRCKCWSCRRCGPKRAGQLKQAIQDSAERLKLTRFVTLTLDPKKGEVSARYLRKCWAKFRVYLHRKYGEAPQYIAVLEFQKNGSAHLHVLVDRFIEQRWIRHTWERLGGGSHVDIRHVDLCRVSHYLAKYLTKELLLSAPANTRRVTTSRGIKLIAAKVSDYVWQMLRAHIDVLFERYANVARDISYEVDDSQEIEGFSISHAAA